MRALGCPGGPIRKRMGIGWRVKGGHFNPRHLDIDVFENMARGDAENALIGFDEIITLASAMLTSEMIGEAEGGGELLGFDKETSSIRLPFRRFHDALTWVALSCW